MSISSSSFSSRWLSASFAASASLVRTAFTATLRFSRNCDKIPTPAFVPVDVYVLKFRFLRNSLRAFNRARDGGLASKIIRVVNSRGRPWERPWERAAGSGKQPQAAADKSVMFRAFKREQNMATNGWQQTLKTLTYYAFVDRSDGELHVLARFASLCLSVHQPRCSQRQDGIPLSGRAK